MGEDEGGIRSLGGGRKGRGRDARSAKIAAHHLASAARLDGRHAALESIRSRLDRIGHALGCEDAAWTSERSTYADVAATLGSAALGHPRTVIAALLERRRSGGGQRKAVDP